MTDSVASLERLARSTCRGSTPEQVWCAGRPRCDTEPSAVVDPTASPPELNEMVVEPREPDEVGPLQTKSPNQQQVFPWRPLA